MSQGQMDRWNIVTVLNYLTHERETDIVRSKIPDLNRKRTSNMVSVADLTRQGFINGDISIVMLQRSDQCG